MTLKQYIIVLSGALVETIGLYAYSLLPHRVPLVERAK
jgi:hypothetical protein